MFDEVIWRRLYCAAQQWWNEMDGDGMNEAGSSDLAVISNYY